MTYKLLTKRSKQLREQNSELLEVLGNVTVAEWMVLGYIHEKPIRISQIAKELDCSMAYCTNRVSDLCAKGLVQRKSDNVDQRAKRVIFTGDEQWFAETETRVKTMLEKSMHNE